MKLCMLVYHHDLECDLSCKKFGFLSSRSRSQCGLNSSKHNCLFHIHWTFEPFATKHGIVVHHQWPECFVAVFFKYCYPHGQGHHEGWNLQGISSKWEGGGSYRTRRQTFFFLGVPCGTSTRVHLICCPEKVLGVKFKSEWLHDS